MELLRTMDTRSIIRYLQVPWWKIPFIARFMRKSMNERISEIRTFKGAEDLISDLSQGFQLGLVTSNSYENVVAILGQNVLSQFRFIECGTSLFGKKARFKKVLKRSGLSPSQIISIGDEVRDIEAAKNLGILSGAVTWGYAKRDVLLSARPDFHFDGLSEISTKLR